MAQMTPAQRDAFLDQPRIATLISLTASGRPTAVPVWYEWDGAVARVFTYGTSEKVGRISADPRVALTVAEPVGVPEAWVTIEGIATIEPEGGYELAARLAPRYYPADKAAASVEAWGADPGVWVVIVIRPERIRSGAPE